MPRSEWVLLGERLAAANPEAYEEILDKLRVFVDATERARSPAVGSPQKPIVLAPPHQRISQ